MRVFFVLLTLLLGSTVRADDWPQYLGPNRNGTTAEKIAVWKTPPRILWRKAVPEGSQPVIADGRLFLFCKVDGKEEEEILALDAVTGKQLWRSGYPRAPYMSNVGNGPRTVPTVSLNRVYAHGIGGILTCYAAGTGKQLWQVDTARKFNAPKLKYGVCCSPLVEGNRVLVTAGGRGAALVAFDTDTGEVGWKALDDPVNTNSPALLLRDDGLQREVVFQTALRLVSVNPADGSIYWQHTISDDPVDTAKTLALPNGLFLSGSVQYGGQALRIGKPEKKTKVEVVWRNENLGAYFACGVPMGKDRMYLASNTHDPGVALRCIDIHTGKELWKKPNVADWQAGLIGTGDDKLLLFDGKGVLRLLADDPAGYRELATAEIGLLTTVNPAFANGRLYLRDNRELLCIQLSQ
jgi:outer membrane protein assembly factor BamB